jgi:hypothetical protein
MPLDLTLVLPWMNMKDLVYGVSGLCFGVGLKFLRKDSEGSFHTILILLAKFSTSEQTPRNPPSNFHSFRELLP